MVSGGTRFGTAFDRWKARFERANVGGDGSGLLVPGDVSVDDSTNETEVIHRFDHRAEPDGAPLWRWVVTSD